ncbi:hypothetical protein FLM9_252 [Candidatus Synechococcus spongiarum]|uniref:Uncharacterized protein n=1 Tax=Candidatus Synechococcus spongiarum TaxID=431041 RepID=A0A171DF11_9SYNE|nr:hypothetical protein FLM9_252 [Candidatus Synechococcus spongiarum]
MPVEALDNAKMEGYRNRQWSILGLPQCFSRTRPADWGNAQADQFLPAPQLPGYPC